MYPDTYENISLVGHFLRHLVLSFPILLILKLIHVRQSVIAFYSYAFELGFFIWNYIKYFDEIQAKLVATQSSGIVVVRISNDCHLLITLVMFGSLWGPLHAITFNVVIFTLLFAHSRAVLSDPGAVPLPTIGLDFSDMHIKKKSSKTQVCANRPYYHYSLLVNNKYFS